MTSSGPDRTPAAPAARGVDLGRLRRGDVAVAGGTLLHLVLMVVPWFRVDGFDLGSGYVVPGDSVNGFDSGILTVASALLLLASAWALLPAVAEVPVPFPRSSVTVGLAASAFVLTLVEWLTTVDVGFTLSGLLTLLTSLGVLAVAALRLLPELVGTSSGRLRGPVRWVDRPAVRSRGRDEVERRAGSSPDVT